MQTFQLKKSCQCETERRLNANAHTSNWRSSFSYANSCKTKSKLDENRKLCQCSAKLCVVATVVVCVCADSGVEWSANQSGLSLSSSSTELMAPIYNSISSFIIHKRAIKWDEIYHAQAHRWSAQWHSELTPIAMNWLDFELRWENFEKPKPRRKHRNAAAATAADAHAILNAFNGDLRFNLTLPHAYRTFEHTHTHI